MTSFLSKDKEVGHTHSTNVYKKFSFNRILSKVKQKGSIKKNLFNLNRNKFVLVLFLVDIS